METSKSITEQMLFAKAVGSTIPVCKKCGSPLFTKLKLLGKEQLLPIMCECRKAEVEEDRKKAERMDFENELQKLRRSSLMDERFKNSSFKNFLVTEYNADAVKTAYTYCDNIEKMIEKNQGLMFWGDVGTGKTFLAACMANRLIEKRYKVIMTSIVKILANTTFGNEDEEFINRLNKADILILDDFGAERKTDFASERVYNIIDSRYRIGKPLIITTNLTVQQLFQRGDSRTDRIYDRILEMCYPACMKGTSFRLMIAKQRLKTAEKLIKGEWCNE